MNFKIEPWTPEQWQVFNRRVMMITLGIVLLTFTLTAHVSAATVSTPVIKPDKDDARVYIPEYCWYVIDRDVCGNDPVVHIAEPTPKPVVKKVTGINKPGKKLPRYRHGHRAHRR